jgi:riboflavin biosynthesis pyrimidine reductase
MARTGIGGPREMAIDFGERGRGMPSSARLRRVHEQLRERAQSGSAQAGDTSSWSSSVAGRSGVAAHLREHRLDPAAERPYVAASVVSSDDGRPALHPHEPARLDEVDAVDGALRDEADAVLVDAGALRGGHFERPLADPARRERRRGHGLTLDPTGIVVSRNESGEPALAAVPDATALVLVYTDAADPLSPPCGVKVTRMASSDLRPRAVLAHARRVYGVRSVLYEGGTQMLGALLAEGALDEVMLTIVPGIEPDPRQPAITELPGVSELAADRVWETGTGTTVLRLHPKAPATAP